MSHVNTSSFSWSLSRSLSLSLVLLTEGIMPLTRRLEISTRTRGASVRSSFSGRLWLLLVFLLLSLLFVSPPQIEVHRTQEHSCTHSQTNTVTHMHTDRQGEKVENHFTSSVTLYLVIIYSNLHQLPTTH